MYVSLNVFVLTRCIFQIVDKQHPTSSPNILFFVEKSMTEANKLIEYLKEVNNAVSIVLNLFIFLF